MLLLCGWEEQNDIWMRRAERWDEKNYFMWMLCLWSKMLPFTGISPGFHLGLPCFGEETMLFWIMFICMFICLYIYSNLLIRYYNMLSDFNKNASHCKEIEIYWSEILFQSFCWGQRNGTIRFEFCCSVLKLRLFSTRDLFLWWESCVGPCAWIERRVHAKKSAKHQILPEQASRL